MADFARYVWHYLIPSKKLQSKIETNIIITKKTIPENDLEQTIGKIEKSNVSSINEPPPKQIETMDPINETPVIKLQRKESTTIQQYTAWDKDSLELLQSWRIKGLIQVEIAKKHNKKSIEGIYNRLYQIFSLNTLYFVRNVPHGFTYDGIYFDTWFQKLENVSKLIYTKFGYDPPREFDFRRTPTSFASVEGLSQLESRLMSLDKSGFDTNESQKLEENLKVYAGRRILFLGIRTKHQEDTLKKYFPNPEVIDFHKGEDLKGLNRGVHYDVLVICGGVASHNIDQLIKSKYGLNFSDVSINAYDAVNPERILAIMAQNANRFKQY